MNTVEILLRPAKAGRSICVLATFASAMLLGSCGGGGGSSTGATGSETSSAVSPAGGEARGRAVKGLLGGATIEVFQPDLEGSPASLMPDESTVTNETGDFALQQVTSPSLVQTGGGSFEDESDQDSDGNGRRRITLGPTEGFESVLFPGQADVAITPYTQMLVDKARSEVGSDNFLQVIEKNRQIGVQAFGFDPFTTMPADPIAPAADSSEAERRYALMLGGIANVINRVSIELGVAEPTFDIILGVIDDLIDGRLNGARNNTAVTVLVEGEPMTLPNDIDLNQQLLRFANNNVDAYNGLRTFIDEDALSASGANVEPVVSGDGFSVDENGSVTLSPAVLGVTDPDGGPEPLNFVLQSAPSFGALSLSGTVLAVSGTFTEADLAAGNVVYERLEPGTESDSFSLVVRDGAINIGATFTVTVIGGQPPAENSPPQAQNDFATVESGGQVSVNVFANDSDPDGDQFFIEFLTQPQHGSFLEDFGEPVGTFIYSHNGDNTETDTFTYQLSDAAGAVSNIATISITVNPPVSNSAPVAVDDSVTAIQGQQMPQFIPVLDNDSDADGDTLSVELVTPLGGSEQGFVFVTGNGFSYDSTTAEPGNYTFTYRANDGTADSNIATVSIEVLPFAVAVDDSFGVSNGQSEMFFPPGNDEINGADAGIELIVLQQPMFGELQVMPGGEVTYTHFGGSESFDSFIYALTNGQSSSNEAFVQIEIFPGF